MKHLADINYLINVPEDDLQTNGQIFEPARMARFTMSGYDI